nr:MAG TPA: hypothetical protein [Caudoviricetes sp.]
MTGANGSIPTYPFNLKGQIENGSPLPHPAPGPVLLLGSRGARAPVSLWSSYRPRPYRLHGEVVHHLSECHLFRGGSGYHACSVLWAVLGDSSFTAESPEVPAGRSAFPCSAASPAAAGSVPRLRVVRFRPGSAGASDCRGWAVWLGSIDVSWGARSLDWRRVPRLVIAWDGGCVHM